jgi:PAS domain S-box-containing protein
MILALVQNISIVIALSVVYQMIMRKWEKGSLRVQILSGFLFGTVALVGMMTPLRFSPGIIFDGRSIILGISGLFGGPIAAFIAAVMCTAYRLYLGGAGALVGSAVIVEAAVLGVGFHYLRRRSPRLKGSIPLLGFGFLVHVVMLLLMFALPGGAGWEVFYRIGLPILTVYPLAMMFLCRLFVDNEERLHTEKSLIENEEQYRTLVENSTGIIWETDTSARFTFISAQVRTILGYEPSEMIGRSVFDFMDPELSEENARQFELAREHSGAILDVENRLVTRDGRIITVGTRATPIISPEGVWCGFRGIDFDISEQKRMEEELRESEKRYRNIFDNAVEGIFQTTPEGRYRIVNPSFAHMFGYESPEEMVRAVTNIGEQLYVNPEDRKRLIEMMRESAGMVRGFEVQLRRKDGSHFWVSINARMIRNGEGEALFLEGTCMDITERELAEEASRETEAQLRNIVASIPNAMVYCVRIGADGSREFKYVSGAIQALHGCSAEEVLADAGRLYDTVVAEERAEVARQEKSAVAAMQEFKRVLRVKTPDGTPRWILLTSQPRVRLEDGSVLYDGVELDITDIKRAEEEKNRLEARLAQAQKMEAVGTLAGGIAHDFNNILGIILGYAEIAGFSLAPDSHTRQSLDEVIKATYRAKDLVKQILTFSRKSDQEQRPLQLIPVVKETLKLLRATLPTTIEIRQEIDLELGDDVVMADATQMHQVLMNLATNSGHAMREHGGVFRVAVSLVHFSRGDSAKPLGIDSGEYIRLTVEDTGTGMDAATIERIFDPYFTTKKAGEGTGLGLAVVHGILKEHNGAITVYSEPGKGTVFNLYLPRLERGEVSEAESQGPIAGGSERLLLVDDEEQLVDVTRGSLELLGYKVTATTSSPEALDLFSHEPQHFDLVITDYTMPKMTGIDLAEKIKMIRSDIPIILCTGFSERINEDYTREIGIRAFLMKPVSLRGLAGLIRKVLDGEG